MKKIKKAFYLHELNYRFVKMFAFSLIAMLFIPAVALAQGSASQGTANGGQTTSVADFYTRYLNPLVYGLGILGGIAVVGGIIWGGIQYAMSGGDAQLVTKGKATIQKALLGLVALFLLVPFLNFLSPGGVVTPTGTTVAECSSKTGFLGFKAWYAYLPQDSFEAGCQIKADLQIMPDNATKSPGVLPQIALAVADDLLRIAALVAVVFVIIGGVKYLTSQGEPAQTKQALSSIINALIGLAIAIIAAAVVSYIGKKLST